MELHAPKAGTVGIIEEANATEERPQKPTLWGRIAGALNSDVRKTARLSIEPDLPDVDPRDRGMIIRPAADPYFIQTEAERIKSKPVLTKVIRDLKLNEAWADKRSGKDRLSDEETLTKFTRLLHHQ